MAGNELKKCTNCKTLNEPNATECTNCSGTEFEDVLSVEVDGDFTQGEE